MKIKNSLSALKLSPVVKLVFPVLAALAAVLRFVQVKTLVDPDTGFYTQSSPLTWVVNLLLIGGACALAVYTYLSEDCASLQPLPHKHTGMFAAALVYAVLLAFNTLKSLSGYLDMANQVGTANFKELMSSGALPQLFQSAFALLSCVYFVFVAISFKKGSQLAAKHRYLALAPTAWVAARLLNLFVRKISFMRVSDLFFELFACSCMILFFLAFAQVVCGVYSTGMHWRLAGFGLAAALLSFGIQLPRLVFLFIDGGRYLNANHPFSITDLCFSAMTFLLCLVMLRAPDAPKAVETTPPSKNDPPASSALDNIDPISFGG